MFGVMPWKKTGNESRPVYPLNRLSEWMEPMFERFWSGWPVAYERWPYEARWAFESEELEKEFVIRAEAPGFEAKEFEVKVNGNVLALHAEHKEEFAKGKENGYKFERHFERLVTLPAAADPEKVEATYKNGILEVHVPKCEEAKPKRVTVKG